MSMAWMDAFNNDPTVRAQQARTIADLREMIWPELDEVAQLTASKLQAREIPQMPRPGEHGIW